jgi:hypothetical protein
MEAGFALGNIARGNPIGAAKNMANAAMASENLGRNLRTLKQGYGQDFNWVGSKIKEQAFKMRYHRRARGDSSFWVEGFSPSDWEI